MSNPALTTEQVVESRSLRPRSLMSPLWLLCLAASSGLVLWLVSEGQRYIVAANSLPPTVSAPEKAYRVKPEEPGGQITKFEGYSVNEIIAGRNAKPLDGETAFSKPPMDFAPEDLSRHEETVAQSRQAAEQRNNANGGLESILEPGESEDRLAMEREILNAVLTATGVAEPANEVKGRILPTSNVVSGRHVAHVADFRSREAAEAGWLELLASYGSILRTRTVYLKELGNSEATVYKLRVAGFEDRSDVNEFCVVMQSQGDSCLPAVAK